jgi:hypothetical protein
LSIFGSGLGLPGLSIAAIVRQSLETTLSEANNQELPYEICRRGEGRSARRFLAEGLLSRMKAREAIPLLCPPKK